MECEDMRKTFNKFTEMWLCLWKKLSMLSQNNNGYPF